MLHMCVCAKRGREWQAGKGDGVVCIKHKRKRTAETQQAAKGQEEGGEGRFEHACVATPAPEQD